MLYICLSHHIGRHDNFLHFVDILSLIKSRTILLGRFHSINHTANHMKIMDFNEDILFSVVIYTKNIQENSLYMLPLHMSNNQMDNSNNYVNKNRIPF